MLNSIHNEDKKTVPNRFGLLTKVICITLLLCMSILFVLHACFAVIAVKSEFYSGGSPDIVIRRELSEHLHALVANDFLELASYKERLRDQVDTHNASDYQYRVDTLEDRYSPQNSNILYKISDGDGNLLASNFTESPTDTLAVYKTDNAGYYGTDSRYRIEAYVKGDLSVRDSAYFIYNIYYSVFEARYSSLILTMILLCLCFADFLFLCFITGRRKGETGVRTNLFDRIPLEILAFAYILSYALILYAINDLTYYIQHYFNYVLQAILALGIFIALFILTLSLFLTLLNRIKTKTFWRSSLCVRLLLLVGRGFKWIWLSIKTVLKNKFVFFVSAILLFASALTDLMMLNIYIDDGGGLFLWFLKNFVLAFLLLCTGVWQMKIADGTEKILKGDLSHKLDTKKLYGSYKPIAENLNHIGDGLSAALAEQMKSERMKTELITNVSHDIKTPLTCIINYVDLLKNEPQESEKAEEYLSVLEKQSAKLKKLIEDLIETSKASSGNLQVNIDQVDLSILLSQAVGEYKDRFEEKELTPIVNIPDLPLIARCDGRLCWRIFDNLLSNALKYSLTGTRIYISAEASVQSIKITVKNISANQLNITPDELTERFVRGDSSRNTEGSGLGLSIAKSLAELQNGSLSLAIDGDLFTAALELTK